MGALEEGGKATGLFFQIMKDQPLSLALVLMNVLLLALFVFVSSNRAREFDRIMTMQTETNKLLYNCVPTSRQEGALTLPDLGK